jgi:hypothetical protein
MYTATAARVRLAARCCGVFYVSVSSMLCVRFIDEAWMPYPASTSSIASTSSASSFSEVAAVPLGAGRTRTKEQEGRYHYPETQQREVYLKHKRQVGWVCL